MKLILWSIVLLAGFSSCNTLKVGSGDSSGLSKLEGTWEMDYISGPRIAFNGLYPGKKPVMTFKVSEMRVSGNSSCNSFSGKLDADDTKINFNSPLISTKMACPGEGEAIFFEMLKRVNLYSVNGDTVLTFRTGDIAMMRFKKIPAAN
jgi:heat shock protein HslJ